MSDTPLYDLDHVPTMELAREVLRRAECCFIAWTDKHENPNNGGGKVLWSFGPNPLAMVGFVTMAEQGMQERLRQLVKGKTKDINPGDPE